MSGTLILLRHGQSNGNAEGVFTGLLDVPLTTTGRAEATRAARLLAAADLIPRHWFCSPMLRARETVRALRDALRIRPPRVELDWRLTERNYGALTGLSKSAVREEFGEAQFLAWRRSVDEAPPPMSAQQRAGIRWQAQAGPDERLGAAESERDVIIRVAELYEERIRPALNPAWPTIVVAHGNSLRALCSVLDLLDEAEVQDLNIPTGQPLVYRIDPEGQPRIRGGRYLDAPAAAAAAAAIAREGGT